ncbi:lamina-associated polypeptide 2, isoforms alpha/zeta-like [Xenopus laevis]|uniref:Lamina-associated polypeptide 2, isoforms alpha/zeta-like n=1 Tax=Xenopus laevis TaxID=8355 RepID=A0A8J1MRB2_XENLA|nr:lamina-associated polypeptide 2, isoforms alpha/zeta-like [Xenopus laevis]XP_041443981.1 lamina-associated polypeptide 2, isoforms alpha/zeta-like [Xenopus laevis]
MEPGMTGKASHPKGKSLPATDVRKDKSPEKTISAEKQQEPGSSVSQENQWESLASVIKQAVIQGFQEVSGTKKRPRHQHGRQGESFSDVSEGDLSFDSDVLSQAGSEEGEIDSEEESTFDLAVIDPLIRAVRQTLTFPTEMTKLSSADKLFPSSKKKSACFPVHSSIKEIIASEWKKTEKRAQTTGKFNKKYPFDEQDSKTWDSPPKVDAAVVRLAKKTTLPVDDAAVFREPMEKKIEFNLRKAFGSAGAACKPAVALTSVSRALKVWLSELGEAISSNVKRPKLLEMLTDCKMATEFISEASIDLVHFSARSMALSVAARRALWLKTWAADTVSKTNLCQLPFEGEMLFGEKLDAIIKKVSGGKSVFLPQESQAKRPRFETNYNKPKDKSFRTSKQYKPGREYSRQSSWRSGRPSSRGAAKKPGFFSSAPSTSGRQ